MPAHLSHVVITGSLFFGEKVFTALFARNAHSREYEEPI